MVPCKQIDQDMSTTYINTNFVRSFGGRRAREYIAAQGPLPGTVNTFVRMLWEQDVKIVVQTTGFMEKGVSKCEVYLPDQANSRIMFGTHCLDYISHIDKPGYRSTSSHAQSLPLNASRSTVYI